MGRLATHHLLGQGCRKIAHIVDVSGGVKCAGFRRFEMSMGVFLF
jgi:DNA-binding LacI/PurR family transcriptional regulator